MISFALPHHKGLTILFDGVFSIPELNRKKR